MSEDDYIIVPKDELAVAFGIDLPDTLEAVGQIVLCEPCTERLVENHPKLMLPTGGSPEEVAGYVKIMRAVCCHACGLRITRFSRELGIPL